MPGLQHTARVTGCALLVAATVVAAAQPPAASAAPESIALASLVVAEPIAHANSAQRKRWLRADSDGDGLTNRVELRRTLTNPLRADSDRDGLSDGAEARFTGTNPRRADSDGDGVGDGTEILSGSDPWDPASVPVFPPPTPPTSHPDPAPTPPSEPQKPEQPGEEPEPPPPPPPADTTPPDTQITAKPAALTKAPSASFSFVGSDTGGSGVASFQCKLDGGSFGTCSSPREYANLGEGSHTFEVRAIDAAGNVDQSPASFNWTIDVTPPAVQIDSGPDGLTNDSTPTFGFSAAGATFECSIDKGTPSFGSCSAAGTHTPAPSLADGTWTFRVRATDAATNQAVATRSFAVDTTAPTAPELSSTVPASPANDNDPMVVGSAPAATTVRLYVGGGCSGAPIATVGPAELQAGVEVAVPDDSTTVFRATATTAAANISGCSEPLTYVEDSGAPETEITAKPATLVNSASASFSFTGNDGAGSGVASFQCKLDGGSFGTCSSPREYANPGEGSHAFEVRAIDAAGNTDASPAAYAWQVDTVPPAVQIDSGPSGLTNDSTPTFTFSAAGASLECSIDKGIADFQACSGAGSHTPAPPRADGAWTFRVRATDAATNQAIATRAFTVDATPPDTQITAKPAVLTSNASASFSFTGSDTGGSGVASFQCKLDAGSFGACSSPHQYSGLGEGSHSVEIRAIDQAGNADGTPANFTWQVDLTPPAVQIDSGPDGLTNDPTPTFAFSAPGASLECSVDKGTTDFKACSGASSHTPGTPLADGNWTFSVRATDTAGNQAIATRGFTVDTTAPPAPELSSTVPASPANDNDPLVVGSAPAATTVRLYVGGGCSGTPIATVGPAELQAGVETAVPDNSTTVFRATATTAAANTSGCSEPLTYVEDSGAPDTQIAAKPAALTNATGASFSFTGSDPGGSGVASFQCKLDGGSFGACESPRGYAGLGEGSHSFEVRAIDAAGNTDANPAAYAWQVDTVPPAVQIDSGPSGLTNDSTPTFTFSAAGATFECSVDKGTPSFGPCSETGTHTPSPPLADGAWTLRVRATDTATNQAIATRGFTVDATPPDTQIAAKPAALTNSANASFSFTGSDPGGAGVASFQCRLDGGSFSTCTAPREYSGLSDGSHNFEVRAIDSAGNADANPAAYAWQIDLTPPAIQIDSGPPGLTGDSTPTFAFSSEPGASFECSVDTGAPNFGPCSAAGSHTPAAPLPDGARTFRVRAVDAAGNQATATRAFTVDATPPDTQITAKPAALTKSPSASFSFAGSDPGGSGVASFQCKLDGGSFGACSSPNQYSGLGEGSHTFEVRAVDNAGNVDPSPASFTWQIDLTPPVVQIDSLSKSLLKAGETSELTWHANENGSFQLRVGGANCDAGTAIDTGAYGSQPASKLSSVAATQLAEGANTLRICLTDAAGNRGSATTTASKDSGAPDTQITAKPAGLTNGASASFSFTGNDGSGSGIASFQCRRDGSPFSACSSPQQYSGLGEGSHTFEVRAIDVAGNVDQSPASFEWTIDLTPPAVHIDSGPDGLTNDPTPIFAFGAAGASFECSVDKGAVDFKACSGANSHTPTAPLADGGWTFRVRATDAAGNQATATRGFTVDTTAPPAPELSSTVPASPANDNDPLVVGSAPANTTVRLYVGGGCAGAPIATVGPTELQAGVEVTVSDNSTTVFRATATTAAANTSGCSEPLTYVEDSGAPDTQIAAKPAALTNSASASFSFTGSDPGGSGVASFQCKLDGGSFTACDSPRGYAGLGDGSHSFEVRAIDVAGNVDNSPATYSWQVDTVPPGVQIDSGPSGLTNDSTPTFTFSAAGATFECSIDKGIADFKACSGAGSHTPAPLADGTWTFRVRATDAATNQAVATRGFTVDATPPDTQITAQPPALTKATSASFSFTGNDGSGSGIASFQCKLDAGSFGACSSPHQYSGLGEGSHTFEVRAIDVAGNIDPSAAPFTWQVDLTPPTVQIDSGPSGLINDSTPTFAYSAPGATFECSVDKGTSSFGPCSGTGTHTTTSPLADGAWTFRVRASDAAGNQAIATRSFTVDATGPDTQIAAKPAALTNATGASFSFTGSDPGGSGVASFQCKLDGGSFGACSSPHQYSGLGEGSHSFEVRAIDAAGNTDANPAAYAWQVDTVPPAIQIDSGPSGLTSDSTPTFTFSAPGATFECSIDKGTTDFKACSGASSHTPGTPLADGTWTFRVRATDAATNQAVATRGFTVDATSPDSQITAQPPALTKATSASFSFTGNDGSGSGVASFQCKLDGGSFGACSSPHQYSGLGEGSHTFEVRAIDVAGNVDPSAAPFTWQVDLTPPTVQIDSGPSGLTNDSTPTFAYSAPDAAFECSVDKGTADYKACSGAGAHTPVPPLADGAWTFRVRATDAAANQAVATRGFTVDATPPDTQITAQPPALTKATSASFSLAGSDPGGSGVASFQCKLDAGSFGACGSPHQYSGLGEGGHVFEVRAIDQAGNADGIPASYSWQVDLTPPAVHIDSGPDGLTNDSTPTFTFNAPSASLECSVDKSTPSFGPCSGTGTHTPTAPLADGGWTFRVRATDAAGNQAIATRAFTVDTTAPPTPELSSTVPASPANYNDPLVVGSAPATTTVRLYVGGGCSGSPIATVSPAELQAGVEVTVSDNSTTVFRATATTAAANTSGCSEPLAYAEDSSAPDTQISAKPPALTNSTSASFFFTGSDPGGSGVASFQCKLDGGSFTACTSPHEYTSLTEGPHTFEVRAIDAAGNIDGVPAGFAWQVDLTPPAVQIDSGPSGPTNDSTPTFAFSSEPGASFECSVDKGTPIFGPCSSAGTHTPAPPLANGTWTFRVRATDAAANQAVVTRAFVVDTTPPDTQITAQPSAWTQATSASFSFTGSDGAGSGIASFQCRRNGGSFNTCTSPREYVGLGEGGHTFEVRARDAAGNLDQIPASFDWTIDVTPPAIQIKSGPDGLTNNPTPTFTFSAPGATFECSIDKGTPSFGPCSATGSHTPAPPLADGAWTFRVRATDAAANQAVATRSFEVDATAPPAPELSSTVPASPANDNSPLLFGNAAADTTVRLYAGGGCSGEPIATLGPAELEAGVEVAVPDDSTTVFRATATTNRTSGCSEPLVYAEDSSAPETTITSAPPGETTSTSASVFFAANEPDSTFECKLDGATYEACVSPRSYADLAPGAHSFSVRATDAAGNLDPTPAEWAWTVESPPSPSPSACVPGSSEATTALAIRSAVEAGENVCVTADVGNVNLGNLGSRPVIVSTSGGSMGDVNLASTTDLTISRARFRSIEMRQSHRTRLLDNTIGGTKENRVLDQLIFMPETSNDVAIEGNDLGWTISDDSGNTGYGCRCYGDLNRLRFVGNKLHDLAADGFQGVGGVDVLIDRNEIGPVGRNPESNEHTDNIQITGNDANLRITNNWIHHQGYYEGEITANAGSTYIHGGSTGSLVYENNLIETAQGRTEICGLGTGGAERSNLTIRRNTWVDGGLAFTSFPSFEWDCDSGSGNTITRNIAIDPDGGFVDNGHDAAIVAPNLFGKASLVTLDATGNCTSANCNPEGQEPIGYRKPSGVDW